jgi:hypothetical protein
VYLTGGHQAAEHFADLAARSERGQEELNLFHAGRDDGLQIDGRENRNGRDLRGRGAFGNCLLETRAQQLPLGGLPDRRDNGDDA